MQQTLTNQGKPMKSNLRLLSYTACGLILAAGCGSNSTTAAPATPDAAAKQFLSAIEKNQPDAAFGMLPASYQADLNGVVKDFATRMDAELWNGARQRMQKIATVAKSKRAIIIEAAQGALPPEEAPKFEKTLDHGIAFVSALANSPFTDLAQLKKGDVAKLLATDGRKLMDTLSKAAAEAPGMDQSENPWNMAKQSTVELVDTTDTTANLKVTTPDGVEEMAMTKVEDAWIPTEMAEEWSENIGELRDNVAKIDFTTPEGQQMKMQANMMFGMLDGVIAQIEAAKTADEVKAAATSVMGMAMGMMMGGGM